MRVCVCVCVLVRTNDAQCLSLSRSGLLCGYLFFPPVVFRSPAHLRWGLVTTGSPHGQGKAVSPPKVSLGSTSLAERSETLGGGLDRVAAMPLTLKLEMPSSSHMSCLLAFDGNHGGGMGTTVLDVCG